MGVSGFRVLGAQKLVPALGLSAFWGFRVLI